MSLRENVAHRLSEVWDLSPIGLGFKESPEGWRALADECLRQMEWARRECSGFDAEALPTTQHAVPYPPGMAEIRGVRIHGRKPLTLATPEWKP